MKKMVLCLFLAVLCINFLKINAWAIVIIAIWEPNKESDLAGYYAWIAFNKMHALNPEKYGILKNDVGSHTSYCFTISDEEYKNGIFIGVQAYDTAGFESEVGLFYWLFSDIENTYYEDVPPEEVIIDLLDFFMFSKYWGQNVVHLQVNCWNAIDIDIPPPTYQERSDINMDGRINIEDLEFLYDSLGKTLKMAP